jgi:hypothetical protein
MGERLCGQRLTKSLCRAWSNRVVMINRTPELEKLGILHEMWVVFPKSTNIEKYEVVKITPYGERRDTLLSEEDYAKHVFFDAQLTEYHF